MHFTGIHTDFLGAKVGACITSAYGKSDSKWPLKSVCALSLKSCPSKSRLGYNLDLTRPKVREGKSHVISIRVKKILLNPI